MRTVRLTLAYDGTRYAGWQRQPDRLGIQQVVEEAIAELTGEVVKVAASGRTDAGVHALGQIVSFSTSLQIPLEGYRWGLVTCLPDDVVVVDADELPYGYHARFDTVRKTYRYVIHTSRTAVPWLRNYVWWHRGELDVAAMQVAAKNIVGTHDFRAFETQGAQRSNSVRTVFEAQWTRQEIWQPWQTSSKADVALPAGSFLCFEISADGFLYNMVRTIVGSLVFVGRGRWQPDDMVRLLAARDRTQAGDTAPAQGLYLVRAESVVDLERIAERRARWSPEFDAMDEVADE